MGYVRVRNKVTGHKLSIDERSVRDIHQVLRQPATDLRGNPLPPEHKTPADKTADPASTPETDTNEEL